MRNLVRTDVQENRVRPRPSLLLPPASKSALYYFRQRQARLTARFLSLSCNLRSGVRIRSRARLGVLGLTAPAAAQLFVVGRHPSTITGFSSFYPSVAQPHLFPGRGISMCVGVLLALGHVLVLFSWFGVEARR